MNITKNDVNYLVLGVILASIAVVVIGNPDSKLGLYGLLGLVGAGVALAIFINPVLGANILIVAIYTNISDQLTNHGYPGIIKPLVAVVFFAILARTLYARQSSLDREATTRIEFFFILYFVIMAFSYLVASNKDRAFTAILDLGKDIVIIYCVLFGLRKVETWRQTMWIIIITIAILCSLGVYQNFTGNYSQDFFGLASVSQQQVLVTSTSSRLGGPINAPNMWGQVIVALISLVMYQILYQPRPAVKIAGVVILSLYLFVVLNTYSRGAYLALGAIIILIIFDRRPSLVTLLATLGMILILIAFLPDNFISRFQSLGSLTSNADTGIYQDASFVGRASEMLSGLAMFEAHPLLGVGAGNYLNNYQEYAQAIGLEFRAEERDPHSLYIQVLSETGILGMIAFLGILFSLFISLARARKSLEKIPQLSSMGPWLQSLQLAFIAYLISSFFLHGAYIRYFWILVAMAMSAIRLINETVNDSGNAQRV